MKTFIVAWLTTAVVFLGLDSIWLSQVAPRFARPIIGELLSESVQPAPAIAFYIIYVTGLVLLAIFPLAEGSVSKALTRGALLGMVAYATYDLTNQATLKVWSTTLTLADIGWGAFISALAAAAGYFVASRFP
ncbi:MAG TPA: DUF2177 family protein [Vitreimonas sp.]|jgi:uncharacterized membrane protein|nr:DUF2177 family protein [Vitreimonas sp.]